MRKINVLEEAMAEIRYLEKSLNESRDKYERALEEVGRLQYRLSNYENTPSVKVRHLTVLKGGKAV